MLHAIMNAVSGLARNKCVASSDDTIVSTGRLSLNFLSQIFQNDLHLLGRNACKQSPRMVAEMQKWYDDTPT